MRRRMIFLCALWALFAFTAIPALAATTVWVSLTGSPTPEGPSAKVLSSDEKETVIEFTVPGFWSDDIKEGSKTYQTLRFPGYFTTMEISKPQLPVITELVAVPGDAKVTVSIVSYTEDTLTGYTVYPFQTPLLETEEPAKFDIDEYFYEQDILYPDESAQAGDPSIWRNLRVVALTVNPIKWNPAKGQLITRKSVTIKLEYAPGSLLNVLPLTEDPISARYDNMYRQGVLNYDFLGMTVEGQQGVPVVLDGYDYLIIAVDEYVDNMASFIAWKNALGLQTVIVPLSVVGYTVTEIKNYIQQEYDNNDIEYVLLVGNDSDIPGYTGWNCFSDYYYTLVAGSDDFPDLALGRFCVHSETDVNTMRDKSILYEKDPPTGGWLEKALLVAHKQNAPGKYQQCKERIRLALETPSLTYSILYPNFTTAYGSDTTVGGDRASNADVAGYIDDGQRVVNYRGHGSNTAWTTWNVFYESFAIAQVNQLNNGEMTPVVFSIACYNNRIDSPSECLGEAFTLSDEAAVACLGASRPSYTTANHTYDKKLFSAIFDEGANAIADASNMAAIKIINDHSGMGVTNARMYLWLGEPAAQVVFTTALAPQVVSTTPSQNELDVSVGTHIVVTWDVRMDFSTINNSSLIVNGSMTGLHDQGVWYCALDGKSVGFNPVDDFAEGEVVTVVLTTDIQSAHGVNMAAGYIWSFTVAATTSSAGTFRHDDDYAVGILPLSVYGAILDADNDIDLAVANRNSADISILLNNGNATFPAGIEYSADTTPVFACAADFDADGDMDLAAANFAVGEIAILLNDGNGVFASYTNYFADTASTGIVTADFNGDGDLDLAVSNWSVDNVSVLFGNGNGAFDSPINYGTGNGPNHIFAADLDNDADVDLMTSNSYSNDVSILLNNGDGTFAAYVSYAVGTCPEGTYAADLDGDGYLDLVTANKGSNNISVLINDGDGTFATQVNYGVGDYPIAVFGSDFNSDGDIDLVTANLISDNVSVLNNNGSGVFGTHRRYSVGDGPSHVYPCDLDGDGDIDLAVSNQFSQDVSILINRQYTPSCPVLFSYDGQSFRQENPLLTACEKSGYVDVVTDYYHLTSPITPENGTVHFQLRELEDEISYLYNIELITVDHAHNTKVACDVDGQISTYLETSAPLSAFDNHGTNQLATVSYQDGKLFTASGPGYLVVTFPNTDSDAANVIMRVPLKRPCPHIEIEEQTSLPPSGSKLNSGGFQSGIDLFVEILADNGNWVEISSAIPSRENSTQDIVLADIAAGITSEILTLRLSWQEGYSTDAVLLSTPAEETPVVQVWGIGSFELMPTKLSTEPWDGFVVGEPLVLTKGDIFEFSFAPGSLSDPDLTRDYVIRAVGRYQPDYSIFTHLLPREFQLHQNYPNPFNPTTTISYDLPQASHVELGIYNVLGQCITTLVDAYQQPGRYQVTWNSGDCGGQSIASGMYFYRLTTDKFAETKKMLLVK